VIFRTDIRFENEFDSLQIDMCENMLNPWSCLFQAGGLKLKISPKLCCNICAKHIFRTVLDRTPLGN